MQHTQAQQIEIGTSIHLAFEQLESRDLSFYLPSTPGFGEGGLNRRELSLQTQSKALQFLIGTPFGPLQPGKQCLALALTDQANKVLAERGESRKARGKAKQCLPIGRILCLQFLWLVQQQPFHPPRRWGGRSSLTSRGSHSGKRRCGGYLYRKGPVAQEGPHTFVAACKALPL